MATFLHSSNDTDIAKEPRISVLKSSMIVSNVLIKTFLGSLVFLVVLRVKDHGLFIFSL